LAGIQEIQNMQNLPHRYTVNAAARAEGDVSLAGAGLATLPSAPPAEFGGPGDKWSPETLLVAAVADCFVLSFRAGARASKLAWTTLECTTEGVLDRVEGVTRFTEVHIRAALAVPAGTSPDLAKRLLEKAEKNCLVSNSLLATKPLEATVTVG
jgi:organic hydroperoxide reductase OsmC/OhrA